MVKGGKNIRFSTVRGLIRMSWNKKNLYNLAERRFYPDLSRRTLFQQMWAAKREIRAYHGGNIIERQFISAWKSEPLPVYGNVSESKEAAGAEAAGRTRKLPPMQTLTAAPIERRLDVAIFRACFQPSVYAARQVISHGKVMVNGKRCKTPSYLLKDGDLFTVDPAAVPMLVPKPEKAGEGGEAAGAPAAPVKMQPSILDALRNSSLQFTPRPFQQPWMFIPEYLEVNFNTCSAVFVRAPMVKPGKCEIPSPFPQEVHGLAHEYYSQRT